MKRTALLLLAAACAPGFGLQTPTLIAQAKEDARPPVYTGQTPAPVPIVPAEPAAVAPAAPPSASPRRSAADLEKLAAPIALHPDPLIAIILPASVYPLEIVQAARFVKDTNNIPKVDGQPWDDNVKEVAKFPDLIAKMDADLAWTVELGQAFIDQPKELMDTIQSLRAKAHKAGTLRTSPQQVVTVTNVVVVQTNLTQVVTATNQIVEVAPANPQVVYVPSYPPTVYYPPPAYVYNPYAPLVTFGVGMAWGAILANNCNWGYGHVDVDVDRNVNRNVDRNTNRGERPSTGTGNRPSNTGQKQWKPDQSRMNKSGAPASAQSREARGYGGASTQPGQRPATGGARPTQQPGAGTQPARSPGAGQSAAQRPSTPTAGSRADTPRQQPSASRQSPSASRPRTSSSSAFGGSSGGSSARSASNRGSTSRSFGGGGGRSSGRGGGGRR